MFPSIGLSSAMLNPILPSAEPEKEVSEALSQCDYSWSESETQILIRFIEEMRSGKKIFPSLNRAFQFLSRSLPERSVKSIYHKYRYLVTTYKISALSINKISARSPNEPSSQVSSKKRKALHPSPKALSNSTSSTGTSISGAFVR